MPERMLAKIGSSVRKYNLIRELPIGTKMYRCRQHEIGDLSVKDFAGMTSPPDNLATQPNRMSPAGVSMFYGAFDETTAIDETIDRAEVSKPFYTVAPFYSIRKLSIVDLTLVPSVPSPFDLRRRHNYYPLIFLNSFVRDLVQPIARDGKVHVNYVPTQVITEYLRYPFSDKNKSRKRIDGMIYASSKTGRNACVLFFNNKESVEVLSSDPSAYKCLPI